jgi:hypothetical protein
MPMWTLLFRPCAALRKAGAFAALAICASPRRWVKSIASSREFDVILRAEIQWFAAILKDAEAKPQ